jgi:hypothetical protein
MNTTIRGHTFGVKVVMALLAVLLLLTVAVVFALQPAPTTSDANPAIHAMSADGKRGSISTQDPYLERHAEVVNRLGDGNLR